MRWGEGTDGEHGQGVGVGDDSAMYPDEEQGGKDVAAADGGGQAEGPARAGGQGYNPEAHEFSRSNPIRYLLQDISLER